MEKFTLPLSSEITLSGLKWEIDNPKANLILVHGAGEHVGRYNHWAKLFNHQLINVYGVDHYGHGNSPGTRGHLTNYDLYLNEIKALKKMIDDQADGLPLLLYGHSLGGNIVLNWILEQEKSVDYVIASAPWIKLKLVPPTWKISLMKWLSGILPALSQSNELDPNWLSRDKLVVERYINDSLVHNKITLSAANILFQRAEILDNYNKQISEKVLIIHGLDDKITDAAASQAFAARTGIDYHSVKGLYHELHNEPEQIEIFNYICNWLNKNGL
ncbi:MAG: lysophospholipase [Saprospiraceae bacterium]|jgi:alpha-beta hydrolase superfamily lysophospholipase